MFSKRFDFLNNIYDDFLRSFTQIESKDHKLENDLKDLFGKYYYNVIQKQIDDYLKENTDYEIPRVKYYRILLAYDKLAENKLSFYECFFVIEMLLKNLNSFYKKEFMSPSMNIDYFIDDFLKFELNNIIEYKNINNEVWDDK